MRVLALAAELGMERLTHLVREALLLRVGHTAGRGNALAEHDLHVRARRQAPVTGQRCIGQRLLGGLALHALGLEQFLALLAFNEPHRNALAHPARHAPHVLPHAVQRRRAIQAQHEELLLVDGRIRPRLDVAHIRPAGAELIAAGAADLGIRRRLEARLERGRAAHARGKILRKIEHPLAVPRPPPRAPARLGVVARHRQRRRRLRVAKTHGSRVELGHQLPHARHLALRRKTGDGERLRGAGGEKRQRQRGCAKAGSACCHVNSRECRENAGADLLCPHDRHCGLHERFCRARMSPTQHRFGTHSALSSLAPARQLNRLKRI
ncbi:hypothetical protein SDC9_129226 [bioreactor metagenome]|uniref:Uncharacterized protein n=1 Tax=bioreactor metagenome TaxID=1076179 RepID=A0A645CZ68_9ZZZZ